MDPQKLTGYDPTKDLGAAMRILGSILDKTLRTTFQIDTQVNVLNGISMALFAFAALRVASGGSLYLLPLAVGTASAAVLGLFALHPPRSMRKRGQEESLLYSRSIVGTESAEAYARELEAMIADRSTIIQHYAREIFNLTRYYYYPKRRLFHAARTALLLSVVVTLLTLLTTLCRG